MHAPIFLITAAISLFASLGSATTYANFCDDDNCSDNCGISVSTDNPGCLQEYNRGSVKFHDPNLQSVNLVTSPDDECSCQNYCYFRVVGGTGQGGVDTCLPLTGPDSSSFRFVGSQSCDEDNC